MIETRTEVRLHCPAELDAPIGALPVVPDGAQVEGNEAGLAWVGNVIAYARALVDRVADAKRACA